MKPIGAFSPFGDTPRWMSFGSLGDGESDERIAAALKLSQERGFRWILQLGVNVSPLTPANEVAAGALERFSALAPYIVAVTYGEEWYELFEQNMFAQYGYPSSTPNGLELVRGWMSQQHLRLRSVIGPFIRIIWLTTRVDSTHHVPQHVDWVALDPYPIDGESFEPTETRLLASEAATTLPLIVIPRWFKCIGTPSAATRFFGEAPSAEHVEGYARFLARPRTIAMWGWLWESRRHAGVLGLHDLPDLRLSIERTMELA